MYKISQFNVSFKKDKNFFIYNSHTENFVKLNEEYQSSYNMIKNGKFGHVEQKHLDDLLDAGFIVENDRNELAFYEYLHNLNRYGNPMLGLTIATTLQCNFRCPYCYESHVDEYFNEKKEELFKNFVNKQIENKSGLSITWYGGEPLLNRDFIDRFSSIAINLCNDKQISYSASMVSNGYLLNREVAEVMVNQNKVKSVQITLDGGPETHNHTRILRNGKGTFDVILKNIKEIYDIIRVTIRVNVSKENVEDVYKLFHILLKEGLNGKIGLYFAPVVAYNEVCQSVSDTCLKTKEFSEWETELIEYADNLGFNVGLRYPRNRGGGICGAVVNSSYVIDAYGDLYKCWHEVGNSKLKIGSLSEGISNVDRLIKWMNWKLPEKCKTCSIMPICKGRCPDLSLEKTDFECHQLKYNIKDQLHRYFIKNKKDRLKIENEKILTHDKKSKE